MHMLVRGWSDGAHSLWRVPRNACTQGAGYQLYAGEMCVCMWSCGPREDPELSLYLCLCSGGLQCRTMICYLHPRWVPQTSPSSFYMGWCYICGQVGKVWYPLSGFYGLCLCFPEHSSETTASHRTLVVTNSPINAVSQISLGRQSQPTWP